MHKVLFLLVQTGCLHEMAVVYVAMTACYFHFQALFTSFLLILPYVIDKLVDFLSCIHHAPLSSQ